MAVAIPAINRAVIAGRQTAIRMEINSLSQAVEQYMQKYGDYPPDGSDRDVLIRHMRRLFPRMSARDLGLLNQLTSTRGTTDFSYVAMDRAEALVFFLGGFSDNQLNPLTGEGGPLAYVAGDVLELGSYQYNGTRDNAFFEFDPKRLTLTRIDGRLMSNDESLLGVVNPEHGNVDPLPAYLAQEGRPTPLVYFDSRTYGALGGGAFNGYLAGPYGASEFGGIRPYMTNVTAGTGVPILAECKFHNPSTFQIISPGLDGVFGAIVSVVRSDPAMAPVYFVTESGRPVSPELIQDGGGEIRAYQDVDWLQSISVNGHLDNITNFSTAALGDDLQ